VFKWPPHIPPPDFHLFVNVLGPKESLILIHPTKEEKKEKAFASDNFLRSLDGSLSLVFGKEMPSYAVVYPIPLRPGPSLIYVLS
jgi:hypothetical protein